MKTTIAETIRTQEEIFFRTNHAPIITEVFEYLTLADLEFNVHGKNGMMTFCLGKRYVNHSVVSYLYLLAQRNNNKGVVNESIYCGA